MKIKIYSLIILAVVILNSNFVSAQEPFKIPTSAELELMTREQKMQIFTQYQQLSVEQKTEVQKKVQTLPSEESAKIIEEFTKLNTVVQETQTQQPPQEEVVPVTTLNEGAPAPIPEPEKTNMLPLATTTLGALVILLALLRMKNKRFTKNPS